MKTILIAHNYSVVSFSAMSYHLAHHLADLGHQVIFISHQPYFLKKEYKVIGKGRIVLCSWPSNKRPTSAEAFFWYTRLHLKYKPNVIIGHFVGSNISIVVSKLLSLGRVKTFEYYHTLREQILADLKKVSIKQKLLFFRKKMFYKFLCDVVVCPSELAKTNLKVHNNLIKGIVLLNPMVDRFNNNKVIEKNTIVISYLGRIDPSKGVVDLINAFIAYKEKFASSRIVLKIAGTGNQVVNIIELIKDKPEIHYLGGIEYLDVDDYLKASHYTIIPSKFDNLPTVGLESMMNKTPILISNSTGLSSYLTEGKDCFKFNPTFEDMIALFEKVEGNFHKYEKMAHCARKTFEEQFNMETYCRNFNTLICNL
ncbi:glycosyltransferase family 4 protein [Flavobacterium sp. K5-23]|uniref:glycosyltransferase family 4 protein n=1 Tax=Flavobacterium sp. K5-23 TaxID=2746225 RepID=UPI00200F3453|nr:glycosyltransferase family 4 protein [Flavobacterium sp. K5-23]UQD56168.1 glycosyltransferase family 4 protein [Flavobacterium sp. K5-23]